MHLFAWTLAFVNALSDTGAVFKRLEISMAYEKAAYDVSEVVEIMGLGRATVYEAIKTGEIPSAKFGRRLKIPGWWIRQQADGPKTTASAA